MTEIAVISYRKYPIRFYRPNVRFLWIIPPLLDEVFCIVILLSPSLNGRLFLMKR